MSHEPSELDIHTEKARDKCRRHEHQGYQSEHFHDLVLVEVDDTDYSVLEVFKSLETEIRVIDQRRNILPNIIRS